MCRSNFLILAIAFLTSACASNIPLEIREDISDYKPDVHTVQALSGEYVGENVRWGGTIVEVENRQNESWVEIVALPLGSYGEPLENDNNLGRFIVRIHGFIDPEIYREGRRITVYGEVESLIVRAIDQYPYTYPLIRSKTHYLWREYNSHYAHRDLRHYPYIYYPYRFGYSFGYHNYPFRRFRYGLHHYYW